MKETALNLLRCLQCKSALNFESESRQNNEILTGKFSCASCSATYVMRNGIPSFFLPELSPEVSQIQSSYTAKWDQVSDIYNEGTFATSHQHEWYLTRYKWNTEENLRDFLQQKQTILDAGCGLGRDVRWYASLNPKATVIGAELSQGVKYAYEKSSPRPNVSVIQADLNTLPFAPETFDFVVCEQVLPVIADPRGAVEYLWSLVKPGGHFAFYLYKKKCPIREFSDDYLRDKIKVMSPEDASEACSSITLLGKALSDLKIEFDVPKDIPELEIKAGRYNLQRFFFYNVLKCFWNDNMSFTENNNCVFDWFHPAYTYRHSVAEVEQWTSDLGMKLLVLDDDDLSGISVLVQKA